MASRAASRTVCRRGDRRVGPVGDGEELSGSGSASYHPALLLGLLVYGYTTGVFSSRKLERATYDSVAFRFIAANDHPDHDTIATFRPQGLLVTHGAGSPGPKVQDYSGLMPQDLLSPMGQERLAPKV